MPRLNHNWNWRIHPDEIQHPVQPEIRNIDSKLKSRHDSATLFSQRASAEQHNNHGIHPLIALLPWLLQHCLNSKTNFLHPRFGPLQPTTQLSPLEDHKREQPTGASRRDSTPHWRRSCGNLLGPTCSYSTLTTNANEKLPRQSSISTLMPWQTFREI